MTSTQDLGTGDVSSKAALGEVPSWLAEPQDYKPLPDRDGFITQSILSVSSVLARLRLDDGASTPLSPSAPVKLMATLACLLLLSLTKNFLFVLAVLAFVIARAALLPARILRRVAATSCAAALLALVVMLPAALLGQGHSALTIAAKALASTALVMEAALTTPAGQLSTALRAMRVPNLVILTVDLALRSIVRLGEVALEVLTALRLRSVGRNKDKTASLGGVGGVVLVKAAEAAQDTHDAMRCRGFEGDYQTQASLRPCWADVPWLVLLAATFALFLCTQGPM